MERTIEGLTAELNEIRKRNIEMQLKAEKDKENKHNEEIRLQEEKKKKEEYESEFCKKYNLKAVSRLEGESDKQSVNMASDRSFTEFREGYAKHKKLTGVKGRSYEELMESIAFGKEAL